MKTTETPTVEYYVIKFVYEAYTLKDETICDEKISPACEIVFK